MNKEKNTRTLQQKQWILLTHGCLTERPIRPAVDKRKWGGRWGVRQMKDDRREAGEGAGRRVEMDNRTEVERGRMKWE